MSTALTEAAGEHMPNVIYSPLRCAIIALILQAPPRLVAAPQELLNDPLLIAEIPAAFEKDKPKESDSYTDGRVREGPFASFKSKDGNVRILLTKRPAAFSSITEYELALPLIKEATTLNMAIKQWQTNEMGDVNGQRWHQMKYQFGAGPVKQTVQYVTIVGADSLQVGITGPVGSFQKVSDQIEAFLKSLKVAAKTSPAP